MDRTCDPCRVKDMDMASRPNDGGRVLDTVTLERDLAKLNLKRPIADYWQFLTSLNTGWVSKDASNYILGVHIGRSRSSDIIYAGGEASEVTAMCERLNEYLRMIRALTGDIS